MTGVKRNKAKLGMMIPSSGNLQALPAKVTTPACIDYEAGLD